MEENQYVQTNFKEKVDGKTINLAVTPNHSTANRHAPILLTTKDSLSQETKAQLKNLKPKKVIILGGKNAIAPKAENQIKEVVSNVRRISGNDRFETATGIRYFGGCVNYNILSF